MKRFLMIGLLILVTGFGIAWAGDRFSAKPKEGFSASLVGQSLVPIGFVRADGSHTWDFPADFGPHPDYQTEWWYYTGNLKTNDGRLFGYQLTFFRRGLIPVKEAQERTSYWGANQVYMGHFALSDIVSDEHYAFERFSRGSAGLAGAQGEPFHVWLENWEVLESGNGGWKLSAEQEGVSLELGLEDEKGLVFHGADGYSQKGPETGNASYYFSQTRLGSDGTVKIKGQDFQVTGLSWMDHEFSTSALSAGQIGWDWFSLQLNDGTDLMVFQIRREDGSIDPFSSGTVIRPDGEVIHIERDQFEIQVKDTWQSPSSGADYPAAWIIQIPQLNLRLEINPYISDQEMHVSYAYWEGAVDVRGIIGELDVLGNGYVEMTGYVASMDGEF